MGAGLRPTAKGVDEPPDPTVRAPALDPTGGGRDRIQSVLPTPIMMYWSFANSDLTASTQAKWA